MGKEEGIMVDECLSAMIKKLEDVGSKDMDSEA